MSKSYRIVLPLLLLWLVAWIVLSWPAIQDDALIHLRFADNLYLTHHITYDGITPSYGASSLLYVALLALLRSVFTSPNLPRAVSSLAHLSLFAGLAFLFTRNAIQRSPIARLLGLVFLCFVASPGTVRWLDDGMETGLAICIVALIVWLTFRQSSRTTTSPGEYLAFVALGLSAVLLRTEFLLPCALATIILVLKRAQSDRESHPTNLRSLLESSHLLVGSLLALAVILFNMHVLLPDTALAKSHGIGSWRSVLSSTPQVLVGALSFGIGLLVVWLVTLALVQRAGRLSLPVLVANSVFPITIVLAMSRGQEIQGARYLVWTYFFSILWNILELATPPHRASGASPQPTASAQFPKPADKLLVYATLTIFLIAQPLEARLMYRVLTLRSSTLAHVESEHLEVLHGMLGVAFDVGYIGYFSQAQICDLAGLVNGRAPARLSTAARAEACARRNPDFIFGNQSQIYLMSKHLSLAGWQVCSQFEFTNLRQPDSHYLLLPPATADRLCHAITGAAPYPIDPSISILPYPS